MRVTLYMSAAFVAAGLLTKYIGRRISDACDWENSNFCADTGFAWEAVGAFLYLGAATFIFVLAFRYAVILLCKRL